MLLSTGSFFYETWCSQVFVVVVTTCTGELRIIINVSLVLLVFVYVLVNSLNTACTGSGHFYTAFVFYRTFVVYQILNTRMQCFFSFCDYVQKCFCTCV